MDKLEAHVGSITYTVKGELNSNPFLKHRHELIKVGAIPCAEFTSYGSAENGEEVINEFTFAIIPEDYHGYRLTALVNRILRSL